MTTTPDQPADPPDGTAPGGPDRTPPAVSPGTEVAVRRGSLDITQEQKAWTDRQLTALLQVMGLKNVPAPVLQAFLHVCQTTGLDPFRREIYLVGRNANVGANRWETKYTPQTGIDGYRHLAAETGAYRGRVGPQWCGPDGLWKDVWLDKENPPVAAKVGVRVSGHPDPVYAVAHFHEYVPMEPVYEGSGQSRRRVGEQPMMMWRKMAANQIAKCAEAQAHRAAFPRQTAGVYVTEEMEAADARFAQDSAERAEAERADARARAAAGEDIVDGETVDTPEVPDVTGVSVSDVLGKLQDVAEGRGVTVAAMARHAVRKARKNLDQFTSQELAVLLRDVTGSDSDITPPVAQGGGQEVLPDAFPDDTKAKERQ